MAKNLDFYKIIAFMTFFFLFFCFLIFGVSEAQMVPAVFVFGDSLVDVGNNNKLPVSFAKANFPHNGIDFPNKKPTGRFSNGKNAADFIAEKVGIPSPPPYLSLSSKNTSGFMTGVSFASGGAGIFNSTDQKLGQALPLTKQVGYYESVYKTLEAAGAQNFVSKSLFVVVIGSNDLFDYNGKSDLQKKYTPQQYVDLMFVTLKGLLQRLYNHGARKFVFAGIGSIGCIPSERIKNDKQECNEQANAMAVKYNGGLTSMLDQLKTELQGLSYSYFNSYSVFQGFVKNPPTYGFSEVKAACCGSGKLNAEVPCLPIAKYCSNRRDHLFWDPYHPTEAAAGILVDTLFNGPPQYTYPLNLRQLLTAN